MRMCTGIRSAANSKTSHPAVVAEGPRAISGVSMNMMGIRTVRMLVRPVVMPMWMAVFAVEAWLVQVVVVIVVVPVGVFVLDLLV